MRVLRHFSFGFIGIVGSALVAQTAHAQTIDYGGLQELFGEPVTTSATGKPQRASEVPVAMDIITADQIRRSGAENIPEILSRLTGAMNWQGARSWSDVGLRGQNATFNPTLLVLINGRQVYLDTYGYTDWSLIPVQLEEIRQIEVVKGANTALFGFNAVSGVINIVTYNPKYDQVSEAGVTAGTGSYGKVQGVQTMKLSDSVNVRISGDLKSEDEFSAHSKTNFASSGPFEGTDRMGHFNLDSMSQLTDQTQLRVEGSHAEADTNDALFYTNAETTKHTDSAKATLTSQTDYGLVEGSLYQNRLDDTPVSPTIGTAASQSTVTVAQLQDLFKVGNDHSFRVLGEYRYNDETGENVIGEGAKLFYNQMAVSGMWNWSISPQWELTNALRVDTLTYDRTGLAPGVPFNGNNDFNTTDTTLGANSGLVWKATDIDTFRISYARGIQVPSLIATGLYLPITGAVIAGNPQLNPAVVSDYELGYDRKIADIDGKFRSSVYYKQTQNIFSTSANSFTSGPTQIIQSANIGSSSTEGFELQLNGKVQTDWTWDLGYTFQTTDDDFTVNHVAITVPLNYEDTFPHNIVNAHLGWAQGPWEADMYGQAASQFKALGNSGTPNVFSLTNVNDYETLSSRLAYRFENDVTVALTGADLLQERVTTNPGLEEDRQVFLSVSKKF